jgi:hypothetical protein
MLRVTLLPQLQSGEDHVVTSVLPSGTVVDDARNLTMVAIAVLIFATVALARRALRPIREMVVAVAAGGLAIVTGGLVLILLLFALALSTRQ